MSLYPAEHAAELKAWLTSELEPICDADPDVLADYVLALLKHPGGETELRSMLSEQLSDFLGDQTRVFVENVFTGLKAKIYLPTAAPAAVPAEAKPTSATATVGAKRRAEDDGDQPSNSAPKAQRTSTPTGPSGVSSLPPNPALQGLGMRTGPVSRHQQEGGHSNGMSMGGMRQLGQGPGPAQGHGGPGGRQQGAPELCRDYHTKGFCARGANCKYIHSSDMITGNMSAFQGVPGMPFGAPGQGPQGMMGPGGMPFQQNGMGGPFGGGGPMPGTQHGAGGPSSSEPTSLAARLSMASASTSAPASAPQGQPPLMQPVGAPGFGMPGFGMPNPMMMMQQQQQHQMGMNGGQIQGGRGGFRSGRGGRGAAGRFGGSRRSDTTLVVENVPAEHLDLIKVNDFFKQFGTLTNIQIDASERKALVSYSSPEEAKAAHSNPEPIFGNRFIKVFFQRLDEEPKQQAAPPVPQQRPAPKQFFGGERSNKYVAPLSPTSQAEAAARAAALAERKRLTEEHAAANYALDLLRGESKTVISKVSAPNASEEVKAEGMRRFMELEKEIKEATERVRKAIAALEAAPKVPPAPSGPSTTAIDPAKREEMERKRLDRELELHAKSAEGQETPEELRAKLAKLQEEAAAIGLDANGRPVAGSSALRGSARGAFRGGFRGRAAYRGGRGGRGGSSSMTFFNLDNRTTKVLVAPSEGESWDEAKTERAKQWAKSFGEVSSLDDADGAGFTATFKTRAHAEQALRSGASIPDVGQAKVSWVNAASNGDTAAEGGGAGPTAGEGEAAADGGEGGKDDLALYES